MSAAAKSPAAPGENAPHVAVRFRANLFWLGREKLRPGKEYHFKCGTQKLPMHLLQVERVINASNLNCEDRQWVEKNEVAVCTFQLASPAAFDTTDKLAATSRFVIVDDYEQSGGGIIVEALEDEDYDRRNIRTGAGAVDEAERRALTGQKGACGVVHRSLRRRQVHSGCPSGTPAFGCGRPPRFCSTAIHCAPVCAVTWVFPTTTAQKTSAVWLRPPCCSNRRATWCW